MVKCKWQDFKFKKKIKMLFPSITYHFGGELKVSLWENGFTYIPFPVLNQRRGVVPLSALTLPAISIVNTRHSNTLLFGVLIMFNRVWILWFNRLDHGIQWFPCMKILWYQRVKLTPWCRGVNDGSFAISESCFLDCA